MGNFSIKNVKNCISYNVEDESSMQRKDLEKGLYDTNTFTQTTNIYL